MYQGHIKRYCLQRLAVFQEEVTVCLDCKTRVMQPRMNPPPCQAVSAVGQVPTKGASVRPRGAAKRPAVQRAAPQKGSSGTKHKC